MFFAHLSTSARAWAMGLPISSVSIREARSTSVSTMSAVAFIHSARCANVVSRNVTAASAASAMRRATSALSCASKVSTVSPVAGLTVAIAICACSFFDGFDRSTVSLAGEDLGMTRELQPSPADVAEQHPLRLVGIMLANRRHEHVVFVVHNPVALDVEQPGEGAAIVLCVVPQPGDGRTQKRRIGAAITAEVEFPIQREEPLDVAGVAHLLDQFGQAVNVGRCQMRQAVAQQEWLDPLAHLIQLGAFFSQPTGVPTPRH